VIDSKKTNFSSLEERDIKASDYQLRREEIDKKSGEAYNRERDCAEKKHKEYTNMHQLHSGELAVLLVSRVLGERKTPKGCESIPGMIENVFVTQWELLPGKGWRCTHT